MENKKPHEFDEGGIIGSINPDQEKVDNTVSDDKQQQDDFGIIGKISDGLDEPIISWQRSSDGTVEINNHDEMFKASLQKFILELEAAGNEPEIYRNAKTEDIEEKRAELDLRNVTWKWLYDSIRNTGIEDWKRLPRFYLAVAKEAKNRLSMEELNDGE